MRSPRRRPLRAGHEPTRPRWSRSEPRPARALDTGEPDPALRVLVVTSLPVPHAGGASVHIEMLVSVLRARGLFEGMVAGPGPVGSLPRRLRSLPRRVLDRDAARAHMLDSIVASQSRAIAKHARGVANLVLHAHDPVATCAALRSEIPDSTVIQTVHGPFAREHEMVGYDPRGAFLRRIRALEAEAFRGAELLLPVDREQARILTDDFGIEGCRIMTIANAVDVGRLSSLPERPIAGDGATEPYFLVPRRLVAKNGVEFAIKAFARLERRSVRLLIAGCGPLGRSLRSMVEHLGLAGHVRFLGELPHEKVLSLCLSAVALVVPSVTAFGVTEATSLAVLEGMAIGVPVIASDIGGIHEIVGDSRNGLLVPPGDEVAIAAAMRTVLDMNGEARARLLASARARVKASFDVGTWAEELIAAYRKARGGS
jgi:glycosyltransferase involved in cell wall biosynthesis